MPHKNPSAGWRAAQCHARTAKRRERVAFASQATETSPCSRQRSSCTTMNHTYVRSKSTVFWKPCGKNQVMTPAERAPRACDDRVKPAEPPMNASTRPEWSDHHDSSFAPNDRGNPLSTRPGHSPPRPHRRPEPSLALECRHPSKFSANPDPPARPPASISTGAR